PLPAILSWPGHLPEGATCSELGCSIDTLPTFLSLAGVDLPQDKIIDGRDILPMARGEAKSPHERLFWEYGDQLAVHEGDWKLIIQGKESFETEPALPTVFLADLRGDPDESENLAQAKAGVAERLSGLCHRWKEDVETRR
ncbi:MAG TPA: sulfatase/phosphatase domain-containing protein, partial [Candidatus Glassbacteria bacterium]|nr:sulfatase/phosphatase domain-containing protein [Candidatus Glassbacteria bacterium]